MILLLLRLTIADRFVSARRDPRSRIGETLIPAPLPAFYLQSENSSHRARSMAFRFNMNTAIPFPTPEVTRLPNESSLTNPFDWLLLLGFPPDAAGRSLGLAANTPAPADTDTPPDAA